MVERQDDDIGAESNTAGPGRQCGQQRELGREIVVSAVVLCRPDMVLAQLFGQNCLADLAAAELGRRHLPGPWVLKRKQQSEVHLSLLMRQIVKLPVPPNLVLPERAWFNRRQKGGHYGDIR